MTPERAHGHLRTLRRYTAPLYRSECDRLKEALDLLTSIRDRVRETLRECTGGEAIDLLLEIERQLEKDE